MGREYPDRIARMCTSKKRYESRHKAHIARAGMRRWLPIEEARDLVVYRCPLLACGRGWHIGHRVTPERLLLLGFPEKLRAA